MWCEGVREAEGGEQDLTHRRGDTGRVDWMFIALVSDNKASVFSSERFSPLICAVDLCGVFA